MNFFFKLFLILDITIILIDCYSTKVYCNTKTIPPLSKYDCSGLIINNVSHPDDTHCCIWKYFNKIANKTVTRCSSINLNQYNNLDQYIARKIVNYTDLDIKCVDDQKLYCSNIVLDEEEPENCEELKISNSGDTYCCEWYIKDSNKEVSNYCASIDNYQYATIKNYIKYKKKDKKYKDLKIDCFGNYFKIIRYFYLLLFFI